ncbi:unnamed protein product [Prunus armeniaca]|uniref:Elongation factor EFG domain-containing protein n=1 Tax=Prunus armeniaca TaxID=36596 RepID=A0A6J5UAJ0_PRUAR|nr:unnamed protein product [Prunus armeniaca]
MPEVCKKYKTENGLKLEPIEEVTIEVNEEHVGLVMEALSHRRAEIVDMGPVPRSVDRTRLSLTCPSRGLVGYRSVFSSDTCGTGLMHRTFLSLYPDIWMCLCLCPDTCAYMYI